MSKNKILRTMLKYNSPLSIEELSKILSCPITELNDYMRHLESTGLILPQQRPYSENIKYSHERLNTVYRCSSIVPEHLRKETLRSVLTVSSIIAAIASVAALIIA